LASHYAREKQEILRDLRNCSAGKSRAPMRLGAQDSHGPDEIVQSPRAIKQTRDQ
jgi:hypothetical protein